MRGIPVVAPANPLRGIASDAAAIRGAAAAVDGHVVLVGHSYGGAVITHAAEGLDNLTGLVYVAAFAPAVGESVGSVQEPFPAPLLASTVRPTPYDAIGAVGGPDLVIDRAQFRETFAADVDADLVEVMAVSQRPLAAAAAGEPLSYAGWADQPTWYLVSSEDRAIAPEAQRFMAERMGATTREIDGSHTAFIARPAEVAAFIGEAVAAVAN